MRSTLSIVAPLLATAFAGVSPVFAACPEPASRAAVALPVAEALQRFGAMDAAGFFVAYDRASAILPCLSEPLVPTDIARFHGMMALYAFMQQDDAGAVNAFRSALAADPTWSLPTDLVPEGHPVRLQLQVAASLKGVVPRPLPDLSPDSILVDGTPGSDAPSDRPTLLQSIAADGHVLESVYILPGGPLPVWVPAPKPLSVVPPTSQKEKHPVALASIAGAALLASGACYGLAFLAHDAFVDPDTVSGYPDDPAALQARANALTWVSIGTGALGLGVGMVAVVRW